MSSSGKGRLSLAFRDLKELHPRIVDKFAERVIDLDLSSNQLSNIDALKSFNILETLVLDKNMISSHTKIPNLPRLTTLWVNHNDISNLSIFIDKLVDSTPNLRYLSMLGNEACPNFLNNGTLAQYNDYRKYIINRLRNLTQLDSDPVTESERIEAIKVYGATQTSIAKDVNDKEEEKNEQEQREREKIQQEKEAAKKRKEEIKKRRLKKLELQRKKREGSTTTSESTKQSEADKPPTIEELLPAVDENVSTIKPDVPLLVANIIEEPPLPPEVLKDIDELTDDDDWSGDDDVDVESFKNSLVITSTAMESDDDDDWSDDEAVDVESFKQSMASSTKSTGSFSLDDEDGWE